jgi:hypothetical protein
MIFSELSDVELAVLGRETYDKQHWSAEDVRLLRDCWDDFQSRGEDTIMFCRPAYSDVQAFHEIDTGKVSEDDVLLLERAGAGIASDYREVVRKLRAVEAIEQTSQDAAGIQF